LFFTPVERPFPGIFQFAAKEGTRDTMDHTLAVEALPGHMLSCCTTETRRYNVYFCVTYQSRGRWAVQSGE